MLGYRIFRSAFRNCCFHIFILLSMRLDFDYLIGHMQSLNKYRGAPLKWGTPCTTLNTWFLNHQENGKMVSFYNSYLINIFTGSLRWNRQHQGQTMHPTENLFKILCVVTWAWLFLTSKVMQAVWDQKLHILGHILHINSMFGSYPSASSAYQRFTEMRSIITFDLHSASISQILEPSLHGLISSIYSSPLPLLIFLLGNSLPKIHSNCSEREFRLCHALFNECLLSTTGCLPKTAFLWFTFNTVPKVMCPKYYMICHLQWLVAV